MTKFVCQIFWCMAIIIGIYGGQNQKEDPKKDVANLDDFLDEPNAAEPLEEESYAHVGHTLADHAHAGHTQAGHTQAGLGQTQADHAHADPVHTPAGLGHTQFFKIGKRDFKFIREMRVHH